MARSTDSWPPKRCPDADCGGRTLYPVSNPFFDVPCACTDCGQLFDPDEENQGEVVQGETERAGRE